MKYLMLFFVSTIYISCHVDDSELVLESDLGYDYFPLFAPGHFKEYEVYQTVYSNKGKNVYEEQFLLREEVVESNGQFTGQASYRVDVSRKSTPAAEWEYSHTVSVELNSLQAIIQHGENRVIHMHFPAQKGKTWDGLILLDVNTLSNVGGENILFYKDWNFEICYLGFFFNFLSKYLALALKAAVFALKSFSRIVISSG